MLLGWGEAGGGKEGRVATEREMGGKSRRGRVGKGGGREKPEGEGGKRERGEGGTGHKHSRRKRGRTKGRGEKKRERREAREKEVGSDRSMARWRETMGVEEGKGRGGEVIS